MKFIDNAKIMIASGNGGEGHVSFRREKGVPMGGPDGGTGGKGGDVVLLADPQLNTLLDFRYMRHYEAENGVNGGKANCSGRDGKDSILRVPCGTIVKNIETGEILADMMVPNETQIIADGGIGGKGNSNFATSTNHTPRYAQPGRPGAEMEIALELKLIADVGFVGLPSVGKSTLISVISAAKPKIADYHFTTLIPNLGIVRVGEKSSYTVADIPGLIEGASEGKGLGHQFLRHVERTRSLVFLVEAYSPDPKKDYEVLMNELCKFNPEMKFKRKIICFSKIDCVDDERRAEIEKIKFTDDPDTPIRFISAVTREEIDNLKWLMWNQINEV